MAESKINTNNLKFVGEQKGKVAINLPTNWNELLIIAVDTSYQQSYTYMVTKDSLRYVLNRQVVNGGSSSSASYWISLNVTSSSVVLNSAIANSSTDRSASVETLVYYR